MPRPIDAITKAPPKIAIYGAPGTGKTCFVTTYGVGLEYLDLDQKLRSAITLKDRWTESRNSIEVTPCPESDPRKAEAWMRAKDRITTISSLCQAGKYPHKVLVIDSFTALADSCLRSIKANSGILDSPTKMTQQLWGVAIDELDRLLVYVKSLPIPVVIVFHDRVDEEGTGQNVVSYHSLNIFGKQLPAKITGRLDEILFQQIRTVSGKPESYLTTVPDEYHTINSTSNLPTNWKCDQGLRELLKQIGWEEKK